MAATSAQRTVDAMLTDRQITLVKTSFQQVVPIADTAAALIYQRIFELAPEARQLFGDDLRVQGTHLVRSLARIVDGLPELDEIGPYLLRLGARHVGYGVHEAHFDIVGQAVLWALEQGLGVGYTDEVREAWTAAYGLIATTMLEGMRAVQPSEPAAV